MRHDSAIGPSSWETRLCNTLLALFFVLALGTASTTWSAVQAAPASIVYIRAGRLFDGTGYERNALIVVEGERIRSVDAGDAQAIPPGATVIDLSDATVLPGLIDCHTHLGGSRRSV